MRHGQGYCCYGSQIWRKWVNEAKIEASIHHTWPLLAKLMRLAHFANNLLGSLPALSWHGGLAEDVIAEDDIAEDVIAEDVVAEYDIAEDVNCS